MRTIKIICLLLLACATQAFADDLTPSQAKAQRSLYAYLAKEKYDPSVDTSDNSVCFHRGGVLYWVTFDEENPILYTFHRNGFKLGDDASSYKRKPAITAANEVNCKHKTVKLSVEEKKVDISIQVYAKATEDFTAVFSSYFKRFDDVDVDFRKAYNDAYASMKEAEEKAEEDAQQNLSPSLLRDKVANMSFRIVDENGSERTAYDQPLRKFVAKFVQPRLELKPWTDRETQVQIQLRVTKPDGKTITMPGKKFTQEKRITISRSRKNQQIELDSFGSSKAGYWKAGEYKVEVIEGGNVIYTTTFNML